MNLSPSFYYGLRILMMKRRKGEKTRPRMLISMISIALSLIPVMVTIVVTNGMIEGITARIIEFESGHLQLTLDFEEEARQVAKSLPAITALSTVKAAYMERQGLGLFFHEKNKMLVSIRAVPDTIYEDDEGFRQYVTLSDGGFDLSPRNSVVVGKALAEEYNLGVGDSIRVYTFRGDFSDSSPRGARVNRLKITGIFSVGYQELDKNVLFVSSRDGSVMLPFKNSETRLKLKVAWPSMDLDSIAVMTENVLSQYNVNGYMMSWQKVNKNHYSAYETTKWLLFLIMMLIVMVATFNIISSMIMVVLDRIQEIGILKSIGASPGMIMFSFVFVGLCTGFSGTFFGVFLGLLCAVNINELIAAAESVMNGAIYGFHSLLSLFGNPPPAEAIRLLNPEYYLEHIPIRIELWEIGIVCFFTLFISAFFALFPAIMAARTKPLEVIRKH
ncbi:MAG: ABC transporter permease [Spirochaetales bacterium]|nr:ABC transporter permease [Spirochaetales bacterium]